MKIFLKSLRRNKNKKLGIMSYLEMYYFHEIFMLIFMNALSFCFKSSGRKQESTNTKSNTIELLCQ